MDKQIVSYKDLGIIPYKTAWDYQESLLQENVKLKSTAGKNGFHGYEKSLINHASPIENNTNATLIKEDTTIPGEQPYPINIPLTTTSYFLVCEHPPVYTIGKSGHMENMLISEIDMERKGIGFYKINRGGDITFHGPGQIVGYPIIDLEKFYTDIGRYLRELEEVIICTLAEYGIHGERSKGETGVWIEPNVPGKERKICAMGVRCSRWITMHGFALNVNTDLSYFENIIPCGIENKKVTSMENELQGKVDINEVKERLQRSFEKVFNVTLQTRHDNGI